MNHLETAILATAVRTFEDLAFIFPDAETSAASSDGQRAGVSISFRGPLQGRLVLTVDASMLPTIAMNMMGEAESPSREHQLDALGEIANVVCGNALPVISGDREAFRLDGPSPLPEGDLARLEGEPASGTVSLNLDGTLAEFRLLLDDKTSH